MEKFKLAKLHDFGGNLQERWYIDYYFLHPETGKFQRFRTWLSARLLTRQNRYLKAKEICNKLNTKLRSGFDPFLGSGQKTLMEALKEVFILKQATNGDRSKSEYKGLIKQFSEWLKENNLAAITSEEFSKSLGINFLDSLLLKGISNRTYNNKLTTLRTIFYTLIDRDYCEINVFKNIKKLQQKEGDISFFTDAERSMLRSYLSQEPQLFAVSLLVYSCFLRPAEICRLQICDIIFEDNTILVKASKSKNKSNARISMTKEVSAALKDLDLNNYPLDYYVFANGTELTPGPNQIRTAKIDQAWTKKVKIRFGITKNIYALKATGAGKAFDAGIDARTIQMQIRHHSLDQTQQYLNKVSRIAGQAFADKMPVF